MKPLSILVALFSLGGVLTVSAEPLRYNRDIRPILSDNCFACQGPDKANQKAGLRLNVRDVAIKPVESGDTAIVPGNVDKSTLVARILTSDEDEIMPPPKSHKKLTFPLATFLVGVGGHHADVERALQKDFGTAGRKAILMSVENPS